MNIYKSNSANNIWINQINKWKNEFNIFDSKFYKNINNVNPYDFFDYFSSIVPENSNIFIDTGCSIAWAMQSLKIKKNTRVFHDFNNTAMGWALPASIGGYYAKKNINEKFISIVGDGSLMMTMYELSTIMIIIFH